MRQIGLATAALAAFAIAVPVQANLIVNPDFSEAPSEMPGSTWEAGDGETGIWYGRQIDDDLEEGQRPGGQTVGYYEREDDPGNFYVWAATGSGPGIFQALDYPGDGTPLIFSFDYLSEHDTGNHPPVFRLMGMTDGNEISKFSNTPSENWTELHRFETSSSSTWTNTGPQAATLSGEFDVLVVQFTNAGGFVDNVVLIPEPAALSLLGLGGLMLLRRRR